MYNIYVLVGNLSSSFFYAGAGDQQLVLEAKLSFLLKKMVIQKLGLDLINQFQMATILVAFVKMIMVSFVLVIPLTHLS